MWRSGCHVKQVRPCLSLVPPEVQRPDDRREGVVPAPLLVADGPGCTEPCLRCQRITGPGELGGYLPETSLQLRPVAGAAVVVAIHLGPAFLGQR
jgi:hypothetical protein